MSALASKGNFELQEKGTKRSQQVYFTHRLIALSIS